MFSPSIFEKFESKRYHSCPCCKRRGQLRGGTAQSFQECSPGCARKALTSEDPTSPVVKAVTTYEHAFRLRQVLHLRSCFFSGGEAEYVDILPLGMGWMPVVVGLPEVCHHGRLELWYRP